MSGNWSKPTDWETVCRRASGRRRYNTDRSIVAFKRRRLVEAILARKGHHRGIGASIAAELGVSAATICRDIKLLAEASAIASGVRWSPAETF